MMSYRLFLGVYFQETITPTGKMLTIAERLGYDIQEGDIKLRPPDTRWLNNQSENVLYGISILRYNNPTFGVLINKFLSDGKSKDCIMTAQYIESHVHLDLFVVHVIQKSK